MSANPLAEVYEKLKELRRQGESPSIQSRIGHQPNPSLDDVSTNTFTGLTREQADATAKFSSDRGAEVLVIPDGSGLFSLRVTSQTEGSIRVLEVRTLADRVFGDGKKAEAWLNRPNRSFSGQKPVDLLKDELGAAVVREALEQIDHGIFA